MSEAGESENEIMAPFVTYVGGEVSLALCRAV